MLRLSLANKFNFILRKNLEGSVPTSCPFKVPFPTSLKQCDIEDTKIQQPNCCCDFDQQQNCCCDCVSGNNIFRQRAETATQGTKTHYFQSLVSSKKIRIKFSLSDFSWDPFYARMRGGSLFWNKSRFWTIESTAIFFCWFRCQTITNGQNVLCEYFNFFDWPLKLHQCVSGEIEFGKWCRGMCSAVVLLFLP